MKDIVKLAERLKSIVRKAFIFGCVQDFFAGVCVCVCVCVCVNIQEMIMMIMMMMMMMMMALLLCGKMR